MIVTPKVVGADVQRLENGLIGTDPSVLNRIHEADVNIVVLNRDLSGLTTEINQLLADNVEIRSSGPASEIVTYLRETLGDERFGGVIADIEELLKLFGRAASTDAFRLLLATVENNMCRRFHTDVNDVRLLCTYAGPGTLWLTDDNVDRRALDGYDGNEHIVRNEDKIQRAATGAVVLLKGVIYPQEQTNAVVHRSPTIEESGQKRLLLRIDTNATVNFWI